MKWLQLEDGKLIMKRDPFGTDVFTLKNIKDHVVPLVHEATCWLGRRSLQ